VTGKNVSYRFERDRSAEVTIFSIDGVPARAGAKATRYFRRLLERGEKEALHVAAEALRRVDEARARWPDWPRPSGLRSPDETELILPALLLADGWAIDRIDRVVATGGRGF
jgi:hypothetical protein